MRRRVMLIVDGSNGPSYNKALRKVMSDLTSFIIDHGGTITKEVDINDPNFNAFLETFAGYHTIMLVSTKSARQSSAKALLGMSAVATRNKGRVIALCTNKHLNSAFKQTFIGSPVLVISSVDEVPGNLSPNKKTNAKDRCLLPPYNILRDKAICSACRRDCHRANGGSRSRKD